MDKMDHKKITRNLTFIKDRIGVDLNAFIDGLIERDIFNINVKEEIESAEPSTLQAKSDIFIRKLLRSGPTAFNDFRDILREKGHLDVLDKMDAIGAEDTDASDDSRPYNRGRTFVVKGPEESDGASGTIETTNVGNVPIESFLCRLQEQTKRELRDEFDRKRLQDQEMLNKRLAQNEETMAFVKSRLDQLAKVSEDYDNLKRAQKGLVEQLNKQRDQVVSLNQENVTLRKEVTVLEGVKTENSTLSAENKKLKSEETKLKEEIQKLERQLTEKENELSSLKSSIENQYNTLTLELSGHKQEWKDEKVSLEQGLNKQQTMLADIAQAIQAINKKMEKVSPPPEPEMDDWSQAIPVSRPSTNRYSVGQVQPRPFIQGTKTTPRSSYNRILSNIFVNHRKK